ncbi:DNA helicase [Pyrococcus yayanosii CH1]|uniref:DNA helicase n=1 Tax=Pyrococcus yayanosii (strain CH1 / JCM 16557) TaxID=529709 RepID=F8AJ98_PYRYC|nr:DNA helicase [Pyrococcus yayanosii CH1]
MFRGLESEIVRYAELPPREGEYGKFSFRNREVNELVQRLGFRLYSHQVRALEKLYAGKNVVVATPTASGKSEIFRLAIFDGILSDPEGRYLLIYPTRALINNQWEKFQRENELFREISGRLVKARILTGDVGWTERRALLREKPHVIFTTPDMLHHNILPRWRDYGWLLRNLRLIVVDELHVYRGVFGTNVAYVFRRLFLRLARLSARPQILALSATLRNPKEFAERFFGLEFEEITEGGNPFPRRHIILFEPRRLTGEQLLRVIVERLTERGIKTLVFFDSRKGTERVMRLLLASPAFDVTTTYKGTLPKPIRWEIERAFREGRLLALLTTNALELGIDIGDLDAVVNYGIPPDGLFSLIQRFGRAGRDPKREAINAIVLRRNGLDYYYREHFEELVEGIEKGLVEHTPVNLDNERIAEKHLHYALNELGVLDLEGLPGAWRKAAEKLAARGLAILRRNPLTGMEELRLRVPPTSYSSIRSAGEDSYIIVLDEPWVRAALKGREGGELLRFLNWLKIKGLVVEEADKLEFYRSLLPGMVYPSRGHLYMVLDEVRVGRFHFIFAKPIEAKDLETSVSKVESIEILDVAGEKKHGRVKVYWGKLRVRHEYTGYAVRGKDTPTHVERLTKLREEGVLKGDVVAIAGWGDWDVFARVTFHEPYVYEFETEGLWLVFPEDVREVPEEEFRHFFGMAAEKDSELALFLFNRLDRRKLFPTLLGATTHYIRRAIQETLREAGLDDPELAFAIKKMVDSRDGVGSALHAIEHNLIKIAPAFTHIDSRELGGYSYDNFLGLGPTVFIYDANEGGTGIIRTLFERIGELMERSYEHLRSCECPDGCPICVLSPRCGTFNEFLDKWAAIKVWERVL